MPEGTVISTSVPAGRQATKGRTITLTVSRGQEFVTVPGVVGNTSSGANDVLKAAGLGSKITEQESSEPPGTVLEQNPAEGENLPPGGTVNLVVAKERPTDSRRDDGQSDGRRGHADARRGRATRSRPPTGRRPIRTWSGA